MSAPARPDSILRTSSGKQRWIQEMRNIFLSKGAIDSIVPDPYVYRVPETLSESKPESYAPKHLGLGPYHHLRPHLYKTHNLKKITAIRKFLGSENLQKFNSVIEKLKEMEPFLRSCYDEYLDLDIETLAWIFAIDGLYLITLSTMNKSSSDHLTENGSKDEFVQDIFMMENQIPFYILIEIAKSLGLYPYECSDHALEEYDGSVDPMAADMSGFWELLEGLHWFCEKHSPLKLDVDITHWVSSSHMHLLHRTYDLIVSNRGVVKIQPQFLRTNFQMESLYQNISQGVDIAVDLGVPGSGTVQNHLKFMESVPWDKILGLFNKEDPDKQNHLVEEIEIPSVSQLTETAKITFELTKGGIKDVKFVEEEKKFYLPVIRLDSNSEVILRNLVAFEAASPKLRSNPVFVQYVDLMCGIVDTPKDVDILRKSKIIEGDLPDEEIARIFNGIKKSTGNEMKPNIEDAIENVNKLYGNMPWVKSMRFLKKQIYSSWKFLSVVSTIILILLLTVQAFCSIYGCSNRWFGPKTNQMSNIRYYMYGVTNNGTTYS